MKRYIKLITGLYILTILLMAGCSMIGASPEDILSKYLDAALYGRYEEAYQYISKKDKEVKSLGEYVSEQAKNENPFVRAFSNKTLYEIKGMAVTGKRIKINVAIISSDFKTIFTDILGAASASSFREKKDEKELLKVLTKKYKNKDIPVIMIIQSFDLVRETFGWKVFFDWKTNKKIDELIKEAEELEKGKRFYAAKEKYQEILEIDNNVSEVLERIKTLDREIESLKYEQIFIKNVEVAEAASGGFGIFGKIENRGKHTLSKVEVTISFLDKKGETIFENNYYPVLTSKWSLDDAPPLKPGDTIKFGVKVEGVPPNWAKKVRVKIINVEFIK